MGPFYALNPLRGGASKGSGAWVAHVKGAKDGKEDWLLEIRIGNRANDAGWVASGDRECGEVFRENRGERVVKRISLSGYSKRLTLFYARCDVM
jgi:hypothetical protein